MPEIDPSSTYPSLPEDPGFYDVFKADRDLTPIGSVRHAEKADAQTSGTQGSKKRKVVLRGYEQSPATAPWELIEVASDVFKIKLYGEYVNKGKAEDVLYIDPDVKEKDADEWVVDHVHDDPRPFARIIRSAVSPELAWAVSRVDEQIVLKTLQPDSEEFIFVMLPTPARSSS